MTWAFITRVHTCRHESPVHPLNNCQGLCCEKSRMLPFITRTWNGNGHSKAACWVHLLRLTDIHIQSMNNPLSALLSTCCCSLHVLCWAQQICIACILHLLNLARVLRTTAVELARLRTVTSKYISQYISPTLIWVSWVLSLPIVLFMTLWIELRKTAWFCSSPCIYVSGLPC